MSVASGLNAIAHSMEGLYAVDGNPIVSLMAEESIRALARGLPLILADPADAAARAAALYGCWLAGTVPGALTVPPPPQPCHPLGGQFALPTSPTPTPHPPHPPAP